MTSRCQIAVEYADLKFDNNLILPGNWYFVNSNSFSCNYFPYRSKEGLLFSRLTYTIMPIN